MKKTILSLAFILLTGIIFGQTLNKGAVLGIHIANFNLQPGVTIEQVEDFYINEYCPAWDESFEDITFIPIKAIRGEKAGSFGMIAYMESDEVRNKYFAEEGVFTEAGQAAYDKLQAINEELNKLIIQVSDPYTDWEVQ